MIIALDSPAVLHLKKKDKRLAAVIDAIGPIECSDHPDAFAFIAKEIVEQMLSVKAAEKIRMRVRSLCGGSLSPEALLTLTADDLRSAGLSRNKAGYLLGFAQAVHEGRIDLPGLYGLPDDEVIVFTINHGLVHRAGQPDIDSLRKIPDRLQAFHDFHAIGRGKDCQIGDFPHQREIFHPIV